MGGGWNASVSDGFVVRVFLCPGGAVFDFEVIEGVIRPSAVFCQASGSDFRNEKGKGEWDLGEFRKGGFTWRRRCKRNKRMGRRQCRMNQLRLQVLHS